MIAPTAARRLACTTARTTARWPFAMRGQAATTARGPEWTATPRPAITECPRGASIVLAPVDPALKGDKAHRAKAETVTPVVLLKAVLARKVAAPLVNAVPARIIAPAMARVGMGLVTEKVAIANTAGR